jgi:hypothetical protein
VLGPSGSRLKTSPLRKPGPGDRCG